MALFFWNDTANYPAGTDLWSGQPVALAPAGLFFTPEVKPPAEDMNYILGQISRNLTTLQSNQQAYGIAKIISIPLGGLDGVSWSNTTLNTALAWTLLAGTSVTAIGSGFIVQPTDYIELDVQVNALAINGATTNNIFLSAGLSWNTGVTALSSGFVTEFGSYAAGAAPVMPCRLRAFGLAGSLGLAGTGPTSLSFALFGRKQNGGDADSVLNLYGSMMATLKVLRPPAAL